MRNLLLLAECGVCQSSLYNSTVVLLAQWSEYRLTVGSVADVQSLEPSLDVTQAQVNALPQTFSAGGASTSMYSVWNYVNRQLPLVTSSLNDLAVQVTSPLLLILKPVGLRIDTFRQFGLRCHYV